MHKRFLAVKKAFSVQILEICLYVCNFCSDGIYRRQKRDRFFNLNTAIEVLPTFEKLKVVLQKMWTHLQNSIRYICFEIGIWFEILHLANHLSTSQIELGRVFHTHIRSGIISKEAELRICALFTGQIEVLPLSTSPCLNFSLLIVLLAQQAALFNADMSQLN